MSATYDAWIHDLALDGDESWTIGDIIRPADVWHGGADDEYRIVERDDALGYWYMERVR